MQQILFGGACIHFWLSRTTSGVVYLDLGVMVMCDESIATEEQRAQAASQGDVLIVDVRTDWNGLPIPDHKKKFYFRAEQSGEDQQAPGRVCTWFMLCSCIWCEQQEWDKCLLPDEDAHGPFTLVPMDRSVSCFYCH